jgi:hypothetical protein
LDARPRATPICPTTATRTIERLLLFRPATDPKIADAWSRLRLAARDQRAPIRRELARLYEAADYRAMAAFMLAANDVTTEHSNAPIENVLARRDPLWGCQPSYSQPNVAQELAEMERFVTEANYRAARDAGIYAMQRKEPVCSLLMETAVATLALAATNQPLPAADFELALRTFVTADAEMNLRPQQGGRSWPYALAARALINYDPPAALVAVQASHKICVSEKCSEAARQQAEKGEAYIRSLFR